jgi:hypothetical protein
MLPQFKGRTGCSCTKAYTDVTAGMPTAHCTGLPSRFTRSSCAGFASRILGGLAAAVPCAADTAAGDLIGGGQPYKKKAHGSRWGWGQKRHPRGGGTDTGSRSRRGADQSQRLEALKAGASGIVRGRNIWQSTRPLALIQAVKALIHGGAKLTEAVDKLSDSKHP